MAQEQRSGGSGTAPASVLIVDSDAGVRRVLDFILQELDCQILLASDGETAMQVMETFDPDLVLAEVRLPDMTGTELAAKMRATGHMETRIALMSAYPRPPAGAEDYFLYKPIRFERLLEIARAAVASHNQMSSRSIG